MDTVTATKTKEQLLAEALLYFGLERKDVERHTPCVWSVADDGLVTIQTALGPLKYRSGDYDEAACAQGHTYPRWFEACKQCLGKARHSLDPVASADARTVLERILLRLGQRKQRAESAKTGGAPGSRAASWGERGVNW
jgi:hypothetical protein